MAENEENNVEETPEAEVEAEVVEETPEVEEAAAETPAPEPEADQVEEDEPVAEAPAEEEEAAVEEVAPEAEPVSEEVSEEAAEAEAPPAEAAQQARRKRKRLPRRLRRPRTKAVRERPAERKPITRLPKPEGERGRRQERRGVVVSTSMDKTIVVRVDTVKAHPKYKKIVRRTSKLHAHDEANRANVGDVVRLVETRPLSKTKRWRLAEVVEEAK
jgi:small subunit ribosomal protein S17